MRKGERRADVCLSVNTTWTAETHGKEVELPQACPWSLGLLGKAASVQCDTHVYLCLSHYLSICTYYCLHFYRHHHPATIIQHTFSSLNGQTVQTNTGSRRPLDSQCLFSRPPEMLEEHIQRCMSFYANILCTTLATDKNPINWEWTKEVCFVGLISSVIDWLDRQILFLWTDLGTSNKTKAYKDFTSQNREDKMHFKNWEWTQSFIYTAEFSYCDELGKRSCGV